MAKDLVRIWVCKDLGECFESFRKSIATELKKKYNLKEVTIPHTLSSQILAAKLRGGDFVNFKIRKQGLNKGILEL